MIKLISTKKSIGFMETGGSSIVKKYRIIKPLFGYHKKKFNYNYRFIIIVNR